MSTLYSFFESEKFLISNGIRSNHCNLVDRQKDINEFDNVTLGILPTRWNLLHVICTDVFDKRSTLDKDNILLASTHKTKEIDRRRR